MGLANCRYFHFSSLLSLCWTSGGRLEGKNSANRTDFVCKSIQATSSTFNIKGRLSKRVKKPGRVCRNVFFLLLCFLWTQITFCLCFLSCIQIALTEMYEKEPNETGWCDISTVGKFFFESTGRENMRPGRKQTTSKRLWHESLEIGEWFGMAGMGRLTKYWNSQQKNAIHMAEQVNIGGTL